VRLTTRVGLAGGAVVFVALAAASLVIYPTVQANLRQQLDNSLVETAAQSPTIIRQVKEKYAGTPEAAPTDDSIDLGSALVQFVSEPSTSTANKSFIPVTERDVGVVDRVEPAYFQDATHAGTDYRVYTALVPKSRNLLVRVARPLSDQAVILGWLAVLLIVLTVAGGFVAVFGARLVATRVLRPVRMLTDTVEHVTRTQDLSARVNLAGQDEISRLGRSFAGMMSALDSSVQAQRHLVADASHELRTPLTSLTTNLELLAEDNRDPEAPALVRDAIVQAGELRSLVNNLIDLARYGKDTARTEDTRLDLVAATVVDRARTRPAAPEFTTRLSPCLVHVDPDAIERAIGNLVDNAVKWSPPGGHVHITVAGGEFVILDEGPGIPPADVPFVFDRFYRSAQARSMPGSGLGLAIVRQVVETHGGQVAAQPVEHGLCMRFRLPLSPWDSHGERIW
jgi:two-component system sensor histidine kinase MprB